MKTLWKVVVFLGIFGVSYAIGQSPEDINLDYAMDGKYSALYLEGGMKDIVDLQTDIKDSKISGPKIEYCNDSIFLSYAFAFISEVDSFIVERKSVFEIYDNRMQLLKKMERNLCQFDTLVRYFIFVNNPSVDTKGFFIQFKIETSDKNKEHATKFFQLPSRFTD